MRKALNCFVTAVFIPTLYMQIHKDAILSNTYSEFILISGHVHFLLYVSMNANVHEK